MKKKIIIALIVIVGGGILYYLLNPGEEPEEERNPAVFAFEAHLATHGDEVAPMKIKVVEELSKLELFYNDSLFHTWNNVKGDVEFELSAGIFGIGTRRVRLLSTYKDGKTLDDIRFVRVLSDITPDKLEASILKEYPHNPQSFTQGLEFWNGKLYEGTGDPSDIGATVVTEVELETGEHLKSMGLSVGYFGEGITIFDSTLYQLTYKKGKCYTYSIEDLQLKGEFNYQGEGWGLCNDGTQLIMSNGTERLSFLDPETFTTNRTIEVYNDKGPIVNLNELEFIDGKIYANVWTTSIVVVIDPMSGKVLQEIDGIKLIREAGGDGQSKVLNGIAIDKNTGKIYMTGKYWSKLFEVEFKPTGPNS